MISPEIAQEPPPRQRPKVALPEQSGLEQLEHQLEQALTATPVVPAASTAAATTPSDDHTKVWYLTTLIIAVLASFGTMLLAGQPMNKALLLAGGVTLLGGEIARRVMADVGPVPSVIITCAVTALAVILVIRGYQLSEVAVIAGLAALVAGEVATRVVRSLTTRREV